ncbi:MAG: ammonium transporter, partial [Bacteroidia bacterium]|nr:ammonium transporter [Bacteroidia bacterium]
MRKLIKSLSTLFLMVVVPVITFAQESAVNSLPSAVSDDQHYNRAIHIMAMLLVGFGFLMVFVRKYGRSALTATFLLVSTSLPLYMLVNRVGLGDTEGEIRRLILAEFGAASLLIAAGAVLGRLKMQ